VEEEVVEAEQQEEQLPNPLPRLVGEVLDPLQRFLHRVASRSSLRGRDLIDRLCLLRTTSLGLASSYSEMEGELAIVDFLDLGDDFIFFE
jgi:hypothetical protein